MMRLIRFIVMGGLFFSMGGHLAVLQATAWTQMVITYSQRNSLSSSLHKTFDGQHPCALCLKVRKASQPDGTLGNSGVYTPADWLVNTIPVFKEAPQQTRVALILHETTHEGHTSLSLPPPR